MDRATDQDFGHETVRLQWVGTEKNERRFYAMIVTLNLFGKAILVRKWRRIGAGGRLRLDLCDDIAAAGAALNDLAHRKHRGGYTEL